MSMDGGKLDEISMKLGELSAYTHEHRHGVNNLLQKFDGLALDVARRVEALDAKVTAQINERHSNVSLRIDAISNRIDKLETDKDRRDGARGLMSWVVQNWPTLVLMAGILGLFIKMGPVR